jgi:hypothetical protein
LCFAFYILPKQEKINLDNTAAKGEKMNKASKPEITAAQEQLLTLLLERDHEICLFFRSLAAILDVPPSSIEEICQGIADDSRFAEKGFCLEIDNGCLKMKSLTPIIRPDTPPVCEPCFQGQNLPDPTGGRAQMRHRYPQEK